MKLFQTNNQIKKSKLEFNATGCVCVCVWIWNAIFVYIDSFMIVFNLFQYVFDMNTEIDIPFLFFFFVSTIIFIWKDIINFTSLYVCVYSFVIEKKSLHSPRKKIVQKF